MDRDIANLEAELERAHRHISLCYRFISRRVPREMTTLERNQLAFELGRGSVALGEALHRVRLHRELQRESA